MPVRDGAAFLEDAIESVLSQTLGNIELVVVDDGSTDATPRILAAAAARDARLRVLTREGRGVVAALNDGCASARAPYIARLDADDVALHRRLEHQAALLDAEPDVGLVGGSFFVIHECGRRRAAFRVPTGDAALRERLSRYNVFAHPATMFRRDAFEQAGGYRLPHAEDYDLWLRIAEHRRLAAVREPVLEYRHHPGQVSLVHARAQALATLAARAAAEERRVGREDPLAGEARASEELLERLGLDPAEIARAVADNYIRWATTLTAAGDAPLAAELLSASTAPPSPFTPRQARARRALGLAALAARGGRPLHAAAFLGRAVALGPDSVAAELRAALERRRAATS
jgi:hypothetical protein